MLSHLNRHFPFAASRAAIVPIRLVLASSWRPRATAKPIRDDKRGPSRAYRERVGMFRFAAICRAGQNPQVHKPLQDNGLRRNPRAIGWARLLPRSSRTAPKVSPIRPETPLRVMRGLAPVERAEPSSNKGWATVGLRYETPAVDILVPSCRRIPWPDHIRTSVMFACIVFPPHKENPHAPTSDFRGSMCRPL